MKCYHLYILVLIGLISCKENDNKKKDNFEWTDISIKNSYEEIIVYKDQDTASFIKYIYENASDNIFESKLSKIERKQIRFSKTEKDSIAIYVQQIISNPVQINTYCTDYVGNLRLKISNATASYMASYNSVCKVDTISNDTRKLFKILNSKIHFSDY